MPLQSVDYNILRSEKQQGKKKLWVGQEMASDGLHLKAREIWIIDTWVDFQASSWASALPALNSRASALIILLSFYSAIMSGRLLEMVKSSWLESNQLLPLSPKLEVGQLPSFIWLLLKSVWGPLSTLLGQFQARWRECPDNWYTPYLHLTWTALDALTKIIG